MNSLKVNHQRKILERLRHTMTSYLTFHESFNFYRRAKDRSLFPWAYERRNETLARPGTKILRSRTDSLWFFILTEVVTTVVQCGFEQFQSDTP